MDLDQLSFAACAMLPATNSASRSSDGHFRSAMRGSFIDDIAPVGLETVVVASGKQGLARSTGRSNMPPTRVRPRLTRLWSLAT